MEYNPEDTDVIHLLKKLKETNGEYPQELLVLRRQKYLNQVAEISGAAGLATTLKNSAKGGTSVGFPPAAGTVVEALLVVALIAEAGAVTFFYRDKLAQIFHSITNSPKVEEISSPPSLPSPVPGLELSAPSPVVTQMETFTFTSTPVVTVTSTETASAPGTPSPELAAETNQSNADASVGSGAGVQSVSTSGPDTNSGSSSVSTPDPKGNNGNHYGQTPVPVRTKEPGNMNSTNNDSSTQNPKKKP